MGNGALKGELMRDSGRFILAILLMVAVIVGSNRLFRPEQPSVAQPTPDEVVPAPEGSGAPSAPAEAAVAAVPASPSGEGGAVAGAESGSSFQEESVVVSSPLYRYSFSTRGGAIVGAELLQYHSSARDGNVDLVPEDGAGLIAYRLRIGDRFIDLRDLEFRPEGPKEVQLRADDGPQTLWFNHTDQSGLQVRLGYTFSPDDYLVEVRGEVVGAGEGGVRSLLVELGPTLASHEANSAEDQRALAYVVNNQRDGIKSVPLRSVKGERIEEGPHRWTALKNKYFLAAVLGGGAGGSGELGGVMAVPTADPYTAQVTTTLPVEGDGSFSYRLYLGPQEHNRLAAIGDGLQDVNPYGWRFLRPIIRPLGHLITWALVGLHTTLNLAYGWVLILFGVLIRVILWPLNARAMRSQMRNMALQPRLKEIQEKHKDNPEQLQNEMRRLMKEEGFNPLGGCLPMLIPFPVLITLFFVFQNSIVFRGTSFLWLADLSAADPYFIMPVLMGISMFVMQLISTRAMPPNPQTKMMMYIMPVMMLFFFLRLASGLNLYYAAQNLASLPQQIQIAKERRKHQHAQQPARAR